MAFFSSSEYQHFIVFISLWQAAQLDLNFRSLPLTNAFLRVPALLSFTLGCTLLSLADALPIKLRSVFLRYGCWLAMGVLLRTGYIIRTQKVEETVWYSIENDIVSNVDTLNKSGSVLLVLLARGL